MADYLGMGEETGFPQQRLNQQQQLAKIANTKATTQHTLASSDYISNLSREAAVRGDMAKLEFDADRKIADLNSIAQGEGKDQDPMQLLTRDAGIYLKSGLVKKGVDLLKAAGQITSEQANAGARVLDAQTRQQKQRLEALGKLENAFANATDEDSWNAAKQAILSADPSAASMVAKLGSYSPEKAAYYQNAVTSFKDKMAAANQTRRNDIYEKLVESENSRRGALDKIDKEKLELSRQREARLAKTAGMKGSKPVGMPSKAELTSAKDQLTALDVEASDADAQEVAQQARILWKNNPGVTPEMASAQVIQDMIKKGDIQPGKKKSGFFSDSTEKGTIFSANRPVPLPPSPDKFVKGQYYQTDKGIVQYVDGVHDKIIKPSGMKSAASAMSEEDDTEEDDDE